MKRVLLLSTVHPSTDSRIMYKIAPSLQDYYEVFCALPGLRSGWKNKLHLINLPKFGRLLPRILFAHPVALFKCLRLRPDIVHIFVPELIPLAFLFQWAGAKVVYEVQENLFKKFAIKRYNNGPVFKWLFRFFDNLARRKFHCVFTDDAYLEEYRDLAKPFAVIHNYVSLPVMDSLAHEDAPAHRHEVFYLGVVSIERSLDTMITAMAMLKNGYPDCHLHVFGPMRVDKAELEAIAGYQEAKSNITFHGYTDQKLALRYARQCVAGIALLKPVADYPESFPTKLFEYMALQLPVVTSDFPAYRQIVDGARCGFCISPYHAEMLHEALECCITDVALRKQMGRNGRKAAEAYYNWASEEAKLLSFYDNIYNS
ncbi:glycosyltransferase involved in cell wall biosynthesis [Dyadobacter sp. BE34]|uniref:Glycosyltransferase involved in cell wall biosynthesis n=1 Tax=Dyadobacter fermentans TaxID=94254 RepID=A0ABU1R7N9_9BACT|nr:MULTISPECIES: glycosyltransferase [Dyadobacter]MDR6809393.1 glycosyltransferase involved in cell wall biosynthesis [Dyadobacter fermentans]MDR7047013.1 glycosyltransferase involved in cell wall biosynthesis [Dyadobacter sp. BE242]MDR7195020.1 glycosyltransferase involved in cell wall biosynthesis [Dyadobacter sp. BE34]MDR7214435.1 glycosyltransferase involved in cell wall biosynthesis [Dyadobacter sp. BE31]MDR7266942.1 glycosyltransferase involved in cell wall biosynthesis [Dyadobacter sp. 